MAHSVRQPLLPPDDDGQSALLPEDQGPRSAGRSEAEPAATATDSRSYLARLTYGWVSPLLHRGSTQPQLHQHDLFELPANLHPAACGRLLRRRWHEEQERQRVRAGGGSASAEPSLLRAVVGAFGWPFFRLGILKAAGDALNFAGPLLLNLLLKHLAAAPAGHPHVDGGAAPGTESRLPGWHLDIKAPLFGFGCAALLAASLILKAFLGAHFSFRQSLIASQLRSAVTVAVFRKALTVNGATLAAAGSGRVQVQYAFLAGLALVLLLIPVNRWLARRIQAASISMMGAKDRRVRSMLEILQGIRQIKSCAWEAAFARRVVKERLAELAALAVRKYLDALCVYFWAATSLLFSLTTFGLFALLGQQLTPAIVFTSLALFNVLLAPINAFPWVINGVVEALVSVRRVSEFLQAPETTGPNMLAGSDSPAADPPVISVHGSFGWGSGNGGNGSSNKRSGSANGSLQLPAAAGASSRSQPTGGAASSQPPRSGGSGTAVLLDIALTVPAGTLVALTGPVGSGKSSLLAAMVGDMLPAGQPAGQTHRCGGLASHGCVAAGSSVAYVPQDPWLMHGTLRQNVLLGQPYNEVRYAAVLHACALLPDLKEMAAGDSTVVGGGGTTLSGGQRARLALARALYKGANVLLLDDCLAAVDPPVAAWILEHALLGPLLWGLQSGSPEEGEGGQEQEPASNQARGVLYFQEEVQQQCSSGASGKQRQPRRRTLVVASHMPALLAAADMVVTMQGGRIEAVRLQPEAAAERRRAAPAAAAADAAVLAAGAAAGAACWSNSCAVAAEGSVAAGMALTGAGKALPEVENRTSEEEEGQGEERGGGVQQEQGQEEERQLGHASRNGSDLWLSHWVSHTTPLSPNATCHHQPQLWGCSGVSSISADGSGGLHPAVAGLHAVPSYPACTWAATDTTAGHSRTATAASTAALSSGSGGGSSASRVGWQLDPATRFYLSVLLAIAAANSAVTLVRAFSFAKGGLVAAKRVHEQLLGAVLALPLSFFDATPPGRIINRFSSDTATVDDSLPFILNILLANIASLAGVIVVLCLTQPLVLAVLPPLAIAYRSLQRYYRATSRELRRLDAVARSPVYSVFSEALSGGPTIRAFAAQPHFLASAEAAVAAQQRAAVSSAAAGSWLSLRLQLMAAALAAAVAGAAVAQHAGWLPDAQALAPLAGVTKSGSGGGGMAAGLVGLSLSYVLPITGLLSALLTSSAETEQEMIAAERVFQYLELPGSSSSSSTSDSLADDAATCAAVVAGGLSSARCEVAGQEGSRQDAVGRDLEAQQPLLQAVARPRSQLGPPAPLSSGGSDWLHSGAVRFEDVWLRYEPWSGRLPPSNGCGNGSRPWVLRGLCLELQAGCHLGICGRTGAGKSSLLAALLRLVPIAAGRILVDGRDIATVPASTLRRAVGVVPQHPFLFDGNVAQNLDPLGLHSHDELVAVLRQVALWPALLAQLPGGFPEAGAAAGLGALSAATVTVASAGAAGLAGPPAATAGKRSVNGSVPASQLGHESDPAALPGGPTAIERRVLAARLGEGCAALSQGQQQLLALARVLLRRPQLLVLDEATSSVDPATADTLHQVICSHLAGATILEVAHRQSTLAGCGRVVLIEAGRVVEERG
ncbi:ABC transporter C family member 13 [Chlorella vulgaris]